MMLASLLLVTIAPAPDFGPMLPPGVNANYQSAVLAVEDKLSASDFKAAAQSALLLPKTTVTVQWDDSKVPADLKAEFASQRDTAFQEWMGITKSVIKVGDDHPDLKFSFVAVLPNPPASGIPAGATYFWSDSPGDVRLETVIGLKRMTPPESINPVNVQNEVAAAVGSYFGLATQPFPGTLMGRSDMNIQTPAQPSTSEMLLAIKTLEVAHDLRVAVQKHQRLTPTRPKVFFDPKSIDMGTVLQGDGPTFTVQITNTGNAPLSMRFTPDCGCVSTADHQQVVQPGATYLLKGSYNTFLTVGQIHHALLVNTNDIDQPSVIVPVQIIVKPRFRFLLPQGNVILLPEGGEDITGYLVLSDNSGITPKDAEIAGVPGKVSMEPWSGTLADPEMNEGPMERHGYKLNIHLTGQLPVPGRDPATLWVTTDNSKFPTLQTNFFAQRGIVALPPELYMGQVGPGPRKYSLQISGPAKKFHVLKVSSDWPHLTFDIYPNGDGTQYVVQATYDGHGPEGPILGSVNITTDDSKQPFISVPINGTIK